MGAQEVPRGSSGRQSPSGTLFHRPRGARNKVAKRFFEDMVQVWDEPTPDGKSTRGLAALRLMWREEPAAFAKLYAGIMPKEFWVDSIASELTDEELNQMLESLRQQLATSDKRHSRHLG
jgi:hypothetical protein